MDKRSFYAIINGMKSEFPDLIILESVEQEFDKVPAISEKEIRALRQYPIQFVKRMNVDDDPGEWTTQLHIWAENGVPEILELDPIFLGFKNSFGDSLLMSLVVAASGAHSGKIDYELINKIIDKDYSYEEITKTEDGDEEVVTKNAMDETDINGKTPIDYLAEIAYGQGEYEGNPPDLKLQSIITGETQEPVKEGFEEVDSTISEPISNQLSSDQSPSLSEKEDPA